MENNSLQYDWIKFYEEFARKLLQYKDNRQELIKKVEQIFERSGIKQPTLEKDNQLIDIDPFTIFGLFNKKQTDLTRKRLAAAIKNIFDCESPAPNFFTGIPVLNPINAAFYSFIGNREDGDIDNLWELFESALSYADHQTEENRSRFLFFFDKVRSQKSIGDSKLTMGIYWIAPRTFLNLDSRNKWYIYESGKMPDSLILTLPEIESPMKASQYIDVLERIQDFLKTEQSPFKDLIELSYEAWRYSEEVNKARATTEAVAEKPNINIESIPLQFDDNSVEEGQAYTKTDFLNDVYIDEPNYDTLKNLLKNKKDIILQGAPGVGKTFAAKRLAWSIIGKKDQDKIAMIQFHQSYSYEDLIMGFRPNSTGFELRTGPFYNFCKKAELDPDNDYFFIIDEINRGNLNKIFGELFMLLENDKRGTSLKLLYSGELFSVPANVYIIGMMNTADRSLAMIDYALRRRFAFFEFSPAFETEGFKKYRDSKNNEKLNHLIETIKYLNQEIEADATLGRGFRIGHSYFCTEAEIDDAWLNSVIAYELIPLLEEYWFDEPEKVRNWELKLRESIR